MARHDRDCAEWDSKVVGINSSRNVFVTKCSFVKRDEFSCARTSYTSEVK